MGRRRVSLGGGAVAYSYVLRPDVLAQNILGLLEQVCAHHQDNALVCTKYTFLQILLSCGGTVLAPLPEDTNRCLSFRPAYASSAQWDSIEAYMGANSRKQRVLVVVYAPSRTGASATATLLGTLAGGRAGSGSRGGGSGNFPAFVAEVHELLCRALAAEGWTLSALTADKVRAVQGGPLDSLVDPHHVRELHDSFLRELDVNVATISHSLLDYITQLEKQCARLMTLLRPIYDR